MCFLLPMCPAFGCVELQGVKIAPACEAAGVKAFPTWVINGNLTEGQLNLDALEQLLDSSNNSRSTAAADTAAANASGQAVAAVQ